MYVIVINGKETSVVQTGFHVKKREKQKKIIFQDKKK